MVSLLFSDNTRHALPSLCVEDVNDIRIMGVLYPHQELNISDKYNLTLYPYIARMYYLLYNVTNRKNEMPLEFQHMYGKLKTVSQWLYSTHFGSERAKKYAFMMSMKLSKRRMINFVHGIDPYTSKKPKQICTKLDVNVALYDKSYDAITKFIAIEREITAVSSHLKIGITKERFWDMFVVYVSKQKEYRILTEN